MSDSESNPDGIRDYKSPPRGFKTDRWFNVPDGNDQMDASRKSDGFVLPAKSANKDAPEVSAEWMEERSPAERNVIQPAPPRMQSRNKVESSGLDRMRGAARKDGDLRFTALLHHADVDALYVGISSKKVNWILDADIEGFFDTIKHDWMMRFLERRIGDRRVLRLIGNWLKAGIMNYHAVPCNGERIRRFVDEITRLWHRAIVLRSQRGRIRWTWERMRRLGRKHLPQPHIIHPYPDQRFRARLKAGAV